MATKEQVFIFAPHTSFEQDNAALLGSLRQQGFKVQVYTYAPGSKPGFPVPGPGTQQRANPKTRATLKAPALEATTGWVVSDRASRLSAPCGGSVALTAAERSFFRLLLENSQRQAARARLAAILRKRVPDAAQANIDSRIAVMVARLRRKVLKQLGTPLPLKVLYGEGYMFTGVLFERA